MLDSRIGVSILYLRSYPSYKIDHKRSTNVLKKFCFVIDVPQLLEASSLIFFVQKSK